MRKASVSLSGLPDRCRTGGLALALLGIGLSGCFEQPAEPEPGTNPLLYEITGPDGAIEGWMLGTIHALPDDVAWRTDAIETVIDEADLLIVEIADLEDRQAIAEIYSELGTSPDLPPVLDRLPPSKRPALGKLIDRANVPQERLTSFETWAAALMLAQVDAQGDPDNGVDKIVISDFDGREVLEFEGAIVQLTIFDQLPEDDQRDLLSGIVDESQTASDDPGRLRRAWLKGDEKALELATTTGIMADAELREALLVGRNRQWTARLASLLRDDAKPLVAVGAAHLVGEDGLPEMLKERGYTVARIAR